MAKRGGKRPKIAPEQEAAFEKAWRESGDLHILADRLAWCRVLREPPPAWVHKGVLDFADALVDVKPYAKHARRLGRDLAVREGHDREGVSWDGAQGGAAGTRRGQPAKASSDRMWTEYKNVRKALRAAGVRDDDPGYRRVDLPDKTRG